MWGDSLSEELILRSKGEIPNLSSRNVVEAITQVDTLSKRIESLHWCLDNLHSFQHNSVREFSFGIIDYFVSKNWELIPDSLHELLLGELFTHIPSDPEYQKPDFLQKLYKIQARIAAHVYPSEWPDLFRVVASMPKQHLFGFLIEFGSSLYNYSQDDINILVTSTLADGSQELILQTILEEILTGNSKACDALVPTVEWMDTTLLINTRFLEMLFQMLEHESLVLCGLKTITQIFRKPMATEILLELINQFNLSHRLEVVLENTQNGDVCECMATLILAAVRPIANQETALQFLSVATKLYSVPVLNATSSIKVFLSSLFGSAPQIIASVLPVVLNKISATVALKSDEADQILVFALSLLFEACSKIGEDAIEILLSLLKQMNPATDVIEIATLLSSLKTVLEPHDNPKVRIAIATFCAPILRLPPPYEPPRFIALANYALLVESVLDSLDPSLVGALFCQCVRLLFYDENIRNNFYDRKNLMEVVEKLCQSHSTVLLQVNDVEKSIEAFVQSGEDLLVSSASHLLKGIDPASRIRIYHDTLTLFGEMLRDGRVNPWVVLSFLKPLNFDAFDEFTSELSHFMECLQDLCLRDDLLFSSFVETATSLLGIRAFPFLWKHQEELMVPENAVFIVEAIERQPIEDENIAQICQIINGTIEHALTNPEQCHFQKLSDEEAMKRRFNAATIRFFLSIIQQLPETFLPSAMKCINFAFFNRPSQDLMVNCLDLYLQVPPQAIADSFGKFYSTLIETARLYELSDDVDDLEKIMTMLLRLLRVLYPFTESFDLRSREWENVRAFTSLGYKFVQNIISCADYDLEYHLSVFMKLIQNSRAPYGANFADDSVSDDFEEEDY